MKFPGVLKRTLKNKNLYLSLLAIIVGVVLTTLLWRVKSMAYLGLMTTVILLAITYAAQKRTVSAKSFALRLALVLIITAVLAYFTIVVVDLWRVYSKASTSTVVEISRFEFIRRYIFNMEMLRQFYSRLFYILLVCVVGDIVFGTLIYSSQVKRKLPPKTTAETQPPHTTPEDRAL
jgi:hypothetical protein